jgi:hypothetical protein
MKYGVGFISTEYCQKKVVRFILSADSTESEEMKVIFLCFIH